MPFSDTRKCTHWKPVGLAFFLIYLYFFFQWEGCSNSLQLLWDDYTETQLLCYVCLLTHELMPFCPSESQAHGMGGAWQKYTPKDKDGWKDSDTTDSTQQQSSVVMPKAAREMKYEHLKLKYLFIDKMWIFLIFWIINPPSGKSVKKLWDFFTASSLVWGCLRTWWFKLAFAGDLCPQKLSPEGIKNFSWRRGHQ